eukprot:333745-Prorocentrum_lima.AAC.1
MGDRLKSAVNDAPRLRWNRLDKVLRSDGIVPTHADRCCYVLYSADTSVWAAESRAGKGGDV